MSEMTREARDNHAHPGRVRLKRRNLLMLAAAPPLPALAQTDWPSRPIRLVVPFATGGAPDIIARLFAQELSTLLSTSVVVENRAGMGGSLGADVVAKAAPDGYTLLLTTTATHSINPALYPNLPYDPERDFTPIGLVARTGLMLVVAPQVPAADLGAFLALLRARPGAFSFASAGPGTMQHITAELFMARTGTRMEHISYRGTGQITADLTAGRVQVMFNSIAALLPLVQAGRLRALGVTTAGRSPAAPGVPTLSEAGLPGFEASAWYAAYGPAGLPAPIVARLNAAFRAALDSPAIRERYAALGLDPESSSPQELAAIARRDLATWTEVIRANSIRPE
jgi:tripartite-type tricarboxylate transporter receptor subunit TctC